MKRFFAFVAIAVSFIAFIEGYQNYGWFEGGMLAAMPLGMLGGWLWQVNQRVKGNRHGK